VKEIDGLLNELAVFVPDVVSGLTKKIADMPLVRMKILLG